LEEPSDREDFQHPDLHGYLLQQAVPILSALLGLVAAWEAKGRPLGRKHRMGGFDKWAAVVGGIVAIILLDGVFAVAYERLGL
jgi:hypothetical protein